MNAKEEEALVAEWLGRYGLRAERFTKAERRSGQTTDFRVYRGDELVAYVEVKSTRDERLDALLDAAAPFEIVGGASPDSTFNRVARHIETAAHQFDAVNGNRAVPNILVYVNHDDMSDAADLESVLTGNLYAEDGTVHPIYRNVSEGAIRVLKTRIDLYVWFDSGDGSPKKMIVTDTMHRDRICDLFRIDPETIRTR